MKAELMIKDDMLLVNGWPIKSWINPLMHSILLYTRNYVTYLHQLSDDYGQIGWVYGWISCASHFFWGFDESDTSGLWWWYITVLASLHSRHSHLGMPSLMIRLGEPLDRVTVECFGANGPKAVEHERGIYRNCWYFARVWDQARITSKRKLRWAQCTVQRFRGREKLLSYLREEFILASNSN